jgi:uncharacterized protein (TIGR03435 family)
LRGNQATLAELASNLSSRLRCPVVDETGTTSRFDFTLTYTFDRIPDPDAPDSIVHDILRSLEPQIGLTLERKKIPADVLVIDHVDKSPKEN